MNISNVILTGNDTAKPATGHFAGRLYFTEDTAKVYRDDGADWVDMSIGGGSGPDWVKPTLGVDTAPAYSAAASEGDSSSGGLVQFGYQAVASAAGVAIGKGSLGNVNTVSIGYMSRGGTSCIVIGHQATTWGDSLDSVPADTSIMIGTTATSYGYLSVGIGHSCMTNDWSTAVGASANAVGVNSVAVGYATGAAYSAAVVIGSQATVFGYNSVAVGYYAYAYQDAISLGYGANAQEGGVSIGKNAFTYGDQLLIKAGNDSSNGGWHGAHSTGLSFFSFDQSDSNITDHGARVADSTLVAQNTFPYQTWGFRLRSSGTTMRMYVNVNGTMKYSDLTLSNV
jgi:hypothetical protein